MFFPDSRIITILGHYGSGKSELAINIALLFAASKETVYLADLDVVNPYFRSRESADFLMKKGINVISSAEDFPGVDLPYMPGNVVSMFQNPNAYGVIDAGGDPAGAKVLARYADDIRNAGGEVLFVVNGNRPMTKTYEDVLKYINNIEGSSGLRVSGLINNTHLMNNTEIQDILEGAKLVKEVSGKTGIPVAAHMVTKDLIPEIDRITDTENPIDMSKVFPIDIFLGKPWEIKHWEEQ